MINELCRGWTGIVLVDKVGIENTMVARNFAYKPIIVPEKYKLVDKLKVKVNKITNFDLRV